MPKIYTGVRCKPGTEVLVDGEPLNPRHDLRKHSPGSAFPAEWQDVFEWGFGGVGPAQLALAIVADHLQDDAEACHIYQAFKFYVVGGWKKDRWKITSEEVDKFIKDLRAGKIP